MNSIPPQELDYLVQTLRNPPPNTTARNVLSYIYNYLPYVKHEHNLKIVFSSFLNNPVCFGLSPLFEDSYLIIEVTKLIFDKKLKVSQPTLPIRTFYDIIYKELKSFVGFDPVRNSWKAQIILTGIMMSAELRDDLYNGQLGLKTYFNSLDNSLDALFRQSVGNVFAYNRTDVEIINLALLSLALKLRPSDNLNLYLRTTSHEYVILKLVELMYGPDGYCQRYVVFGQRAAVAAISERDVEALIFNPVMKHVNRVSTLLERLFSGLNYRKEAYDAIFQALDMISSFNKRLNLFVRAHSYLDTDPDLFKENTPEKKLWFFFKSVLFSQILIFQGIITRFVESRNIGFFRQFLTSSSNASTTHRSTTEMHYTDICYKIIQCLYYTNFILVSIGQGGFDGYNFVYYVSLELCCKNNISTRFQTFSRCLIGNYEVNIHHASLNASYVSRSKVLFVLGLFESYFQQTAFKDRNYETFIFDVSFELTENQFLSDPNITEAGHSVLLAYFSKTNNDDAGIARVLQYFEVLLGQFPSRVSAMQLSMAVETLGKKIMTSPIKYDHSLYESLIDHFLLFIYFKCMNTASGVSISQKSTALFASAQPIPNTDANSTVSQLPENSSNKNIVEENKHKKLKDLAVIDVLLFESGDPKQHFAVRQAPETAREGLILAFLNIIPYLPLSSFELWIEKIWLLITTSNMSERQFLTDKFWVILSENLDLNRCEIAYVWWYEKKKNVEFTEIQSKF